jgi:hypothetical protein
VAKWVEDGEPFVSLSVESADGIHTATADDYLPRPDDAGFPGPCPDGVSWGDWLVDHNID